MKVELTINELENLLMMHDYCKRHFSHTYALSAVAKLNAARKEYLKEFGKQAEMFEVEKVLGK